jgi:hypothetical protein
VRPSCATPPQRQRRARKLPRLKSGSVEMSNAYSATTRCTCAFARSNAFRPECLVLRMPAIERLLASRQLLRRQGSLPLRMQVLRLRQLRRDLLRRGHLRPRHQGLTPVLQCEPKPSSELDRKTGDRTGRTYYLSAADKTRDRRSEEFLGVLLECQGMQFLLGPVASQSFDRRRKNL